MEIISTEVLSVRAIHGNSDNLLPRSRIYLREKEGEVVVGVVLEVCIKIGDFFLIFMTDDIPGEDMLRIYLLDQDASVRDSITIGSPYSTGSFRLVELVEPNLVTFTFVGCTVWNVCVSNKEEFHIPFFSDPKGVSRKMCFSSFLKVTGTPVSESRK